MDNENIYFETEDIHFELTNYQQVSAWINQVIHINNFTPGEICFIFCSDEYLHKINLEYLDHDTFTDIITFNNADEEGLIEGDIFVSIDRVKENSIILNIPFEDELHRVIIHGILHSIGFDDINPELKTSMRTEEDKCLSLRKF